MNLSIFSNIWHYDLWGGVSSWGGRNWMEWWRMILAPIRCLMMDRLSPSSDCSQTPTQGENSRIKIWIFWRWNESSAIESRPISHKTKDKVYLKISPRGGKLEHQGPHFWWQQLNEEDLWLDCCSNLIILSATKVGKSRADVSASSSVSTCFSFESTSSLMSTFQ